MHVVKPRARRECDTILFVEARVHVAQVARVRLRLDARMRNFADGSAEVRLDAVVEVAVANVGPLLEFDEHRGVDARRRGAENERVEPSGTQRKLHLEYDAVIANVRVPKLRRKRAQRIAPRREFRRRRSKAIVIVERFAELFGDSLLRGFVDEEFACAGKKLHALLIFDGTRLPAG